MGAWEDLRSLMALFLMEHGSSGGEYVWGGGCVWEGQSPECNTTVHASFKQAHAPFIHVYSYIYIKLNTLCSEECGAGA